ncbi:MAG: TIGR03067 domain-containing protein [Gemmataceae bacterium]|nr:TIGR03067 domain-containing protein [Gemmataceae bacterium]
MLRLGAAAVVCGLVGAAVAQEPPVGVVPAAAAAPTGDLLAVQGYWKPLAMRYDGKPVPQTADELAKLTAVIEGGEYHLYFKAPEKDRPLKLARMVMTLDPTTSPKQFTFEFQFGPLKGQKRHGVYEVAGNELRLCYGPADKPAPTKFEAPAGSGYFHEVWAKQPGK